MATAIRMPDMGTVEGDVRLVRWLKAEGESVALGEPLFEVETDKGVSEVEAALAGVLVQRVLAEGDKAGPGETIAYIRRPGETEEAPAADSPTTAAAASPSVAPRASQGSAHSPAPSVAPSLQALAEKWGVALDSVKATGPGGRITRQDILAARGGAAGPAPTPPASAGRPPVGPALSSGQSIVARKVSQSHREKPVYRVTMRVDMGKAIAFRAQAHARGESVSWDALFVKAAAMVIGEMPLFRRWFKADELLEHPAGDVAVAIGIGDELSVPAVRGPASKSPEAISREIAALANRAETRALQAQDVEGSCFLVSNLGMFPVESFDAIIYPDHAAALAAGAATATVATDGATTWIAHAAHLTLSVDHRLINGTVAARFLTRVKEILETGAFA